LLSPVSTLTIETGLTSGLLKNVTQTTTAVKALSKGRT
jgi:hypothetical protein